MLVVLAMLKSFFGAIFTGIGDALSWLFKNPIYIAFIAVLIVGGVGGGYYEKHKLEGEITKIQQQAAADIKARDTQIAALVADSKKQADADKTTIDNLNASLKNDSADYETKLAEAKKSKIQTIYVPVPTKDVKKGTAGAVISTTDPTVTSVPVMFENGNQVCSRFTDEAADTVNLMIADTNKGLTAAYSQQP